MAIPIPTVPKMAFPLTFAKFAKTLFVVTALLTARFDRMPTDVMFGWAGAVTERAVPTVPIIFEAWRFERPDAFPVRSPPNSTPDTFRPLKVPSEVIFVCAFPVTAEARVEKGMVPTMFADWMFERACPDPTMSPETASDVSVPTEVMFVCAAPETDDAKGTDPTIEAPGMFVSPTPSPEIVPPMRDPVTDREDRVPTEVMLGWAFPVTAPAVVAKATVPTMFETERFERAEPSPANEPAVTSPETAREDRVPTEVMLVCALPATLCAKATLPTTFEPLMDDRACPVPVMSPETARALRTPTDVMLVWAFAVTTTAAPTAPTTFDPGMLEIAEASEAISNPATRRPVRIPTEVMADWADCVTICALPTVPETFEPLMEDRA